MTVAEITASSVLITGAVASTVMDSVKQAGITNVSIVTQPLQENAVK